MLVHIDFPSANLHCRRSKDWQGKYVFCSWLRFGIARFITRLDARFQPREEHCARRGEKCETPYDTLLRGILLLDRDSDIIMSYHVTRRMN